MPDCRKPLAGMIGTRIEAMPSPERILVLP
jgi:hypothetical protein